MVNPKVQQIRTNALVAKSIYTRRLRLANAVKICTTILVIITPILFIAAQYLTKNSSIASLIDSLAFLASVSLLCVAIITLIVNLEGKIQKYLYGIHSNTYVATEALKLINEASDEKLGWFYTYVAEMDSTDAETLANASKSERQDAYRAALMQLFPGDNTVLCPICGASPFMFKRGGCQVCGNLQANKREDR